MKNFYRIALVFAGAMLARSGAWALGFRNPDQGALATGQGEAFVAQADDPSAIYYNPAGLAQLEGTQFSSGLYVSFPNIRFYPVGDGELTPKDDVVLLPHFYAASDFGWPKWRFGLGFNVPFGSTATWGGEGRFAAIVDKSQMAVYNIAPTVACQINEEVSVGAGLNIYYGDLLSRFRYLPPFFASEFEFRGDGLAAGATVGLLWKPHWQHSFGVVWRSPFSVNFSGSAVVHNPPPPAILPDPGPSPANITLDFPQSVAVGYAFRPTKRWKLEVDVEWTNWDTLSVCRLHSPNPYVTADPRSTVAFNWKDSFYYEFGTQYELNDNWSLLAGYIFSENTVPDSTYSPVLPDSDRHVFSVGAGFRSPRLAVTLIYQYSHSADRTVTGSPGGLSDGEWKSDGHAVMLTSTLKF
ncbi:MAG: outer membrane protein transport protein [Verrucomicrobiae bacterium]|nr:outer membrane protein transport protein [Verrucomicrobiae bacterium]